MKKLLFLLLFIPTLCYGQTAVKADILSMSKVTLGESADEVRFMPEKLVSVKEEVVDGKAEYKTYIEPKLEFDRWNKENTLSLSIPSVEGYTDKTVDEKTGEVVIRNKTEGFYFRKHDGETVKFGLILYEIPSKDKIVTIDGIEYYRFDFTLSNYEDLVFIKIPELTAEGLQRPEGIAGSWNVFHKTKRNNQYKFGDFCVIYKARFIDSNGKTIYGITEIKDGVFSELCPKDFADNAIYPLKSNATFGYTGALTDPLTVDQNYVSLNKFQLTEAGSVTSITIRVDGAAALKGVIFDDDGVGGIAGTLLGVTNAGSGPGSPDQATLTFATPVSLSAGYYWIGAVFNDAAYSYVTSAVSQGNSTCGKNASNNYASPTTPGALSYYDGYTLCVYATYTASGGASRRRMFIISKHEIHTNSDNSYCRLSDCLPSRRKDYKTV